VEIILYFDLSVEHFVRVKLSPREQKLHLSSLFSRILHFMTRNVSGLVKLWSQSSFSWILFLFEVSFVSAFFFSISCSGWRTLHVGEKLQWATWPWKK
jgi:hypothetical protein